MNEALIENWNKVVKDDNTVFILGDLGFCGYEKLEPIMARLKGKKYLIQGNHDSDKIVKKLYDNNIIEDYYKQFLINIENYTIHLNHFPFLTFPKDHYQLFGHVHLTHTKNNGEDFERCSYLLPNQYEVGVDFNNYTPVSWEIIKERLDWQVKNNVNCLYWINYNFKKE